MDGRSEVLDVLNPKGPPELRIRHTLTWNSNPIQCAAGVAACREYLSGAVQARAAALGAHVREKGNEILASRRVSGRLYGRTIIHLYLGRIECEPDDVLSPPTASVAHIMDPAQARIKSDLCLRLLQRGVATMGARMFIMSAVHDNEAIDRTMTVFGSCLEDMIADGVIASV